MFQYFLKMVHFPQSAFQIEKGHNLCVHVSGGGEGGRYISVPVVDSKGDKKASWD